MANTQVKQVKPSPEYIENLRIHVAMWNREDKRSDELLKELNTMLEKFKTDAYRECKYEAFAHIDRIIFYINTTYPKKLLAELEYVKGLPSL